MDDLHFSRSATWELLDGKLTVHDSFTPRAPRLITMEPWYAAVFLAAEGTLTIRAFVERLATEYESGPPPGLGETVNQVIRTLVGEGILRTHERPIPLPRYFQVQVHEIPPDVRADLMRADGLIT